MTKPPPPVFLPFNKDPALAIEQAIMALKDIEKRAPGTRGFFDYESFIHHELQPALDALRTPRPEAAPTQESELRKMLQELCDAAAVNLEYTRYSGIWKRARHLLSQPQRDTLKEGK